MHVKSAFLNDDL
jgi:hypothetical protein